MGKNSQFCLCIYAYISILFRYVLCLFGTILQIRLKILAKLSDEVKSPLMKLHNSLNGKVCLMAENISHIQAHTESVATELLKFQQSSTSVIIMFMKLFDNAFSYE